MIFVFFVEGGGGWFMFLVESFGCINYGLYIGEGKGIMGGVMIGWCFVNGWMYCVIF